MSSNDPKMACYPQSQKRLIDRLLDQHDRRVASGKAGWNKRSAESKQDAIARLDQVRATANSARRN